MSQPDFGGMMKKMQELQGKMLETQEAVRQKTVEAAAGGGMVKVVVSGALEVRKLTIDPSVVDAKDVGMLEDLVTAAVNQGLTRAQEMVANEMRAVTAGMGLPPGLL